MTDSLKSNKFSPARAIKEPAGITVTEKDYAIREDSDGNVVEETRGELHLEDVTLLEGTSFIIMEDGTKWFIHATKCAFDQDEISGESASGRNWSATITKLFRVPISLWNICNVDNKDGGITNPDTGEKVIFDAPYDRNGNASTYPFNFQKFKLSSGNYEDNGSGF